MCNEVRKFIEINPGEAFVIVPKFITFYGIRLFMACFGYFSAVSSILKVAKQSPKTHTDSFGPTVWLLLQERHASQASCADIRGVLLGLWTRLTTYYERGENFDHWYSLQTLVFIFAYSCDERL